MDLVNAYKQFKEDVRGYLDDRPLMWVGIIFAVGVVAGWLL